jgi:adenylate cyclase
VYGRIDGNAEAGGMNARLERKLRLLAAITVASVIGGVAFVFSQGFNSVSGVEVGIIYGLLLSVTIGGISLFVLEGPMRVWLGGLSFTTNLMVRSAIYAIIIIPILFFQIGDIFVGVPPDPSHKNFWVSVTYSIVFLVLANLVLSIANIIGPRAFLNFISGRYHTPVEENRFVLFVDIAGSTGLAERLGGIAIHRLLDRTFRLLTLAVVDYRGEVLNYVGDEVIVTWREKNGAIDCRPLRCFVAMREELSQASNQLQHEFGAVPRIRGSLHFGPVIVGEIGDIKARHRLQRRRHEYRSKARGAQPQCRRRLSRVPRGDGPVRLGGAICGARPRAVTYSRARRWDRRGRHRRPGFGLIRSLRA